jgi:hypothetical protein
MLLLDRLMTSQRAHLGKYAHEERMPDSLVTLLRKKGQVTAQGEQMMAVGLARHWRLN